MLTKEAHKDGQFMSKLKKTHDRAKKSLGQS